MSEYNARQKEKCLNPHCRQIARERSEYCSWFCKRQHERQLKCIAVAEEPEGNTRRSHDRFSPWSPFR